MKCPFCGNNNTEDAAFCVYCGKHIPSPNEIAPGSSPARCPKCGSLLAKDAAFCGTCGEPVSGRGAPAAPGQEPAGPVIIYKEREGRSKPPVYLLLLFLLLSVSAISYALYLRFGKGSGQTETVTTNGGTDIAGGGGNGGGNLVFELTSTPVPTPTNTPTPTPTNTPTPTPTNTPTPTPTPTNTPTPTPTNTPTPTPTNTPTPSPTPTPVPYDPKEGGIHRYALYRDDCTWSQAFQKAKNSGGYLARINSKEEFDYIVYLISANGYDKMYSFSVGGRRDMTSTEYYWVDENNQLYGERLDYGSSWAVSNWLPGEPSYIDGTVTEHCMDLYCVDGHWALNDIPDDVVGAVPSFSGKLGYIVEYED